MPILELEKTLKTSAAGQYLGYSLQQLRLCHHLFRVPDGDMVSFEYLDDVAIHRMDGLIVLEQSKSALSGNPAANKSEVLWKCFANWASLCTGEIIDADKTDFVLYVSPTKTGGLVAEMHQAGAAQAAKVLAKIKKLIDPANPGVGCSPHIKKFLSAGYEVCSRIIVRFSFVTDEEPTESVRQFVRPGAPPEALEGLTAAAIGIARDRIDRLIRTGLTPADDPANFRRAFRIFAQRSNLNNLLLSTTSQPSIVAIESLVSSNPTFVQQLISVEAGRDLLVTAVSDYLRTEEDKIRWADEGRILNDTFDQFDEQLMRHHKLTRDEIEDMHMQAVEASRGRMLYRRCSASALPLEGQTLPSHFIAGSYNYLADNRRLGWHPNFSIMFPVE